MRNLKTAYGPVSSKIHRRPALLLVVALAVMLTACGGSDEQAGEADPAPVEDASSPITDDAGQGDGVAESGSDTDDEDIPGRLPEMTKITVSVPCQNFGCLSGLVLDSWGHFSDRNLEVELVQNPTTDSMLLLAQGDVDAAMAGGSVGLMNAIASGLNVRVVAPSYFQSPDSTAGFYVSTAALEQDGLDPESIDVDSFDASWLSGKQVGSSQGNAGQTMVALDQLASRSGVSASDMDIVTMPESDQLAALPNGAIALGVLNEPQSRITAESGEGIFVGSHQPEGLPLTLWVFGENLLADQDVGNAFMAALIDLHREMLKPGYSDDPEVVAELARAMDVSEDDIRESVEHSFPDRLEIPEDIASVYQSTWRQWPDLLQYEEDLTFEEVVDARFMEFANER